MVHDGPGEDRHGCERSSVRLRGLLRATTMITSDLALPSLRTRIVEAARELVGAHHAALGVIGPDGQLAEFVHVGMAAQMCHGVDHRGGDLRPRCSGNPAAS
ncbi:hypothetical protein ACQPXB_28100 [Amycolatopsis sp. CA-161197]|uniref:hypothetical protein n=1 Tax=Amycolatopsis sp. CA-161197 TaxID=3239922 RepID=UPI003D8F2455